LKTIWFAKSFIYREQKPDGLLVLNRDNERCREFAKDAPARVRWFSAVRPCGTANSPGTEHIPLAGV
jgi:UDP-N-acetylmuramoylalanine-D-glutamate ligase